MSARRTHTKSRTGCTNCKRRKVKCDEAYPACFNCRRHDVPCSLSGGANDISTESGRLKPPAVMPGMSAFSPGASPNSSSSINGSPDSFENMALEIPTIPDEMMPCAPHELWSHGLELMHHFTTITADTLTIRKEMSHVWKVVIPREGYSHPYVMHGVLAVAAVHKAWLFPSLRQKYLALADYHQTLGSEGFRADLALLNAENWMPLFSFASIVVFYMLSLPSRMENRKLEEPMVNLCELIILIRGMRASLIPMIANIYHSEFAPIVYGMWPINLDGPPENFGSLEATYLPADTFEAVRALRKFIEANIPSDSLEVYLGTVDAMQVTAKLVALAGPWAELSAVLHWMYAANDSLLLDIQMQKPHACLVVAYIAVFIASLEKNYWFVQGWGSHLLEEAEAKLAGHPGFQDQLWWPKKRIGELRTWF